MAALVKCPVCNTPIERSKTSHYYERDMPAVVVLACGHPLALESGTWGDITTSTAASNNLQFIRKMKGLKLL